MRAWITRQIEAWLRAPLRRSLGRDREPEFPWVALALAGAVLLTAVATGVFVHELSPVVAGRGSFGWPALRAGRWDVLAWNKAADNILGFSRLPEADRNTLISVLTNPATRRLFGSGWADEAKRMVAQFRATHDLWAGDPAFRDLLALLREGFRNSKAGGARTTSAVGTGGPDHRG